MKVRPNIIRGNNFLTCAVDGADELSYMQKWLATEPADSV